MEDQEAQVILEVLVLEVADPETHRPAIAERFANNLAEVAHDHIHLLDPDLVPEELQIELQERLAIDLQHYLWDSFGVGVGSRAHSCRGNNADQFVHVTQNAPIGGEGAGLRTIAQYISQGRALQEGCSGLTMMSTPFMPQ